MRRSTHAASSRPSDRRERVERPRRSDRDFSTSSRRSRDSARNDAGVAISRSESETERIAARFARTLRGGEIILLTGELGAGKTVFVRGLARALGVRGRITSPTFVMMRVYEVGSRAAEQQRSRAAKRSGALRLYSSTALRPIRHFIHVDAYRVHDTRELEAIGLDEWIGRPDTVVAIEWGERVRPILHGTRTWSVRLAPDPHAPDDRRIVILPPRVRRRT